MADDKAKIIVGASPVGTGGQRHTYLLFERSNGNRTIVRGGPNGAVKGNGLANFAGNTVLGSDNYGNIDVQFATYTPPFNVAFQKQTNGSKLPIPVERINPYDRKLEKDHRGNIIVRQWLSPDWPLPGEHHERVVVWTGTDQELDKKLSVVLTAKDQINSAQLEYSSLRNNCNNVTSTLLKSVDVKPSLPLGTDGNPVTAPGFGDDLYQNIGPASYRNGYRFDGRQWYNNDNQPIKPPRANEPVAPLKPGEKTNSSPDIFDSSDAGHKGARQASSTGNPQLDRLAAALLADDNAAISRMAGEIAQFPEMKAFVAKGHDLLVAEENRQHEMKQHNRGRSMSS